MSSLEEKASKKFWKTPELVEMMLPHLDASSILELAKAHPPIIEILQGRSLWDKIIQRSTPYGARRDLCDNSSSDDSWLRKTLKAKKAEILPLVKILAIMEEPQEWHKPLF